MQKWLFGWLATIALDGLLLTDITVAASFAIKQFIFTVLIIIFYLYLLYPIFLVNSFNISSHYYIS